MARARVGAVNPISALLNLGIVNNSSAGGMLAGGEPSRVSFTNLLDALWKVDQDDEGSNQTYAAGGRIAPNERGLVLDSVIVEGAGELRLPLSCDDRVKLLGVCEQAPFGRGLDTVVDTAVRRAWQVDASKVTLPGEFASKTVQRIANRAVRALGLDGAAVQVEAHLYKLLLYEPGGHFSLHRDTEKEPGMLATLVIQLPTEGGFEGGSLIVRHGGATKTFNFSMQSSTDVFYTVFFADCEHELEKVTSGTRLCLAFNLVRGSDESFGSTMQNELKGFSSRLAKVEAALRPLLRSGGESTENAVFQRLAIPLRHKYTKTNLSFARLKGKDRMVAQVLRSCRDSSGRPWLDLHLCMVTKYQSGLPYDDGYNCRYDLYEYDNSSDEEDEEDEEHTMEEVHDEYVNFTNWVGTNNKPCSFEVEILRQEEIAMGENEELFEDDANPDETEYEGHTGNAGPTLMYWYHKAAIVIWSKKLTPSVARKVGYDGALGILECKAAEKDPDAVTMLHGMLIHWENQSSGRISTDSGNSRLLELCLSVGGRESFLHALRLLLKTGLFQPSTDWSTRTLLMDRYNGISGEGTAAAIAKGVQVYGWSTCASHVLELLKKDVTSLCSAYCNLAFKLQALGCHDAASVVAKRTLEAAMAACSSWKQLTATNLDSLTKLFFSFKETTAELGGRFLNRFNDVGIRALHTLVVKISSQISKEVLEEEGSAGATLFTKICELIISRDFHRWMVNTTGGSQHEAMYNYRGFYTMSRAYNGLSLSAVDVVLTFCKLGREELLSKLLQALVNQSRQYNKQHLLKQLLDSDAIWRGLSSTRMGMSGLQILVEERVNSLAAKAEPVFTWCMPSARLPSHPTVEAFLRSPQERFTYKRSTLGGLPGARKFAHTFFNGSYQNGFSGTGIEGGRGVEAFCVITKTRTAFQHEHNQWVKDQAEIKALRDRLMKTQAAASTQAGLGIRAENVIQSPDPNTLRVPKKRRVEEPETVDLTLDDD